MKYTTAIKPLACIMTQSTCYKNSGSMTVKGVLWHSTGANNAFIKRYVQPDDDATNRKALLNKIGTNAYKNDWNHVTRQAGVNAFIGKLADGTVTSVQTLPWNMKPWGCGSGSKGSCNGAWCQFEICEDALTDKTYFNKVFEEGCQLTAYICKMYNLDPLGSVTYAGVKVPVILCHKDAHDLKLGSDHGDVIYWFKKYGKTMKDVRNRVKEILDAAVVPVPSDPAPSTSTKIFEVGDVVKIIGTKYYSGKIIPDWVKKKNWVVSSAPKGSSRIVLGKSEDGKDSVDSAFNAADLQLIKRPGAIQVGDLVRVIGKTYYSGKAVPTWVLNDQWYVKSISGDKYILGQNKAKNNTLDSAFLKTSLQKV